MRVLEFQKPSRRIIAGAVMALAAVGVFLFWPTPKPLVAPLPRPNGYDDLVKAGPLLSNLPNDYQKLSAAELRQLVTQNATALQRVRAGLERECRVPVTNSPDYFTNHTPNLVGHRHLALTLAAEGQLAELDQRPNDAARSYLDAIRLGHAAARGGLLIDHLVGMACESIGSMKLASIVSALDAKECRATIARLESIESKREPPEDTLRIEREWSRQTSRFGARLGWMIAMRSWDPARDTHKRYLARLQAEMARQAQIRLDLATRAYELEQGRPPAKLDDLVPAYLKALPPSPSTLTNSSASP